MNDRILPWAGLYTTEEDTSKAFDVCCTHCFNTSVKVYQEARRPGNQTYKQSQMSASAHSAHTV